MLTRLALLSLSKGALHAIGRAKPESAMSQVNVPGRLSKRGLQRLDSLLRQYGNGGIEPLDEEYGELVERLSDMNQQLDTESQEASTESARVAVEADLLSALALAVDVGRRTRRSPVPCTDATGARKPVVAATRPPQSCARGRTCAPRGSTGWSS